MTVVDKQSLAGTERNVSGPGWCSMRLLVKSDGTGFPMTETHVLPGAVLERHRKHHLEACYCINGQCIVLDKATRLEQRIKPGVLYAPNLRDVHQIRVEGKEPFHLICVFSPALQGDEVHGPDGGCERGAPG